VDRRASGQDPSGRRSVAVGSLRAGWAGWGKHAVKHEERTGRIGQGACQSAV